MYGLEAKEVIGELNFEVLHTIEDVAAGKLESDCLRCNSHEWRGGPRLGTGALTWRIPALGPW